MKRQLLLASTLLLAACGQKQATVNGDENVTRSDAGEANAVSTPSEAPRSANQSVPAASEAQPGALPAASAGLRFIGRWATSKANCAAKPWVFTKDELTATGGPHCSIYNVRTMPGGYDLAVECPAKKPVPTDLVKLRFAESAQAMLLESNAIEPTGLIYCGK